MGKRYTYNDIKTYFENNNCTLLTPEFSNISAVKDKLDWLCSCGNSGESISFYNFKRKEVKLCKQCRYDHIKETHNKKYGGVGNASSILLQKVKNTKMERYGNEKYNNFAKSQKTLKEKYGVDNFGKVDTEARLSSCKATNNKKYGVDYPLQSDKIHKKIKK